MASFKKSLEGLKNTTQSATKGVTDSTVQAAQDAVQQVAESSKETTSAAAEEASRQTQSAIGTAAEKASDTIKELSLVSRETKNQKLSVLSATVKSKDHHPLRFFWKTNHLQPASYFQHLKGKLGVRRHALAVKSLKIWIQCLICRAVE
ncbi:hypothetical protein Q8A67_013578 [Cirrhinus molitorella]|uniref:Uncharacterized protein n=1 Tax=Cirrhinus molitorella TaxID=172907 RepID=A0AA88TKQ8_9TELE|nr:hypothetical protein Q8A67_013578 [Cirrhinus molitorella]